MTGAVPHPWPWRTAVLLFAVSVLLLGRQLDFHGYVHDDEPNKVMQIAGGNYNYNHPLLMLHSVKLYAQLAGISGDYDRVIRAGRWSSVIFSALAVGLLVLVAGRLHGAVVGAVAGVFVLTTPLFFELAHYFKEDPALLFGLSLSLVAMQIYSERPSLGSAAMLGAACGVAISGKYAGLMILPFAVYAIFSAGRKSDVVVFALFLAGTFCLINWPMISSPEVWRSRIDREVSRLQAEDVPNRRETPHGAYLAAFTKHASPVLFGLIAMYVWNLRRRKFRLSCAELTIVLLPVLYLLALSFIPTKSDRYILPASVLLAVAAAAGLQPVLAWRHGKAIAALLVAAGIAWQAPRLYAEDSAFASTRHDDVLQYLHTQLPQTSSVLVDNYNALGPPEFSAPKVSQRRFQPGETTQSLRNNGFTHVLVTAERYPVFAPDSRRASGFSKEMEQKVRLLYEELFTRCRLVHEWKEGNKKKLEPEFLLYELPQ